MPTEDVLHRNVVCVRGALVGTGFFFDYDGSILTCFHFIRDPQTGKPLDQPISVFFDQQEYPAQCILHPPDPDMLDFAILRLVAGKLPRNAAPLPIGAWSDAPEQARTFRTRSFSTYPVVAGIDATGSIVGHTHRADVPLLHLTLEQSEMEPLRVTLHGAPVYHEATQQIVGMITASEPAEHPGTIMSFALPMGVIAEHWTPLRQRRFEHDLWQQVYARVLDPHAGWFTERSFQVWQAGLPGMDAWVAGEGNDIPTAVGRLRMQLGVYELINHIKARRPDIPLQQLLDLPPVHRLDFVNRADELTETCDRYAPPYVLIDAPPGYGKTALLRAIAQHYLRDGWHCVYVETPDPASALELARSIATHAGLPASQIQRLPLPSIAYMLAGYLAAKLQVQDSPGVVMLIDNLERVSADDIDAFLSEFIAVLQGGLPSIRVRLAGRLIGAARSRKIAHPLELRVVALPPLQFRDVRDMLRHWAPTQPELDLRAAHLTYLTGGHPGCLAALKARMERCSQLMTPAERHFQEQAGEYATIVCEVGNALRQSMPHELQEVVDVLSIFRRYNYRLLQQMIDAGIIVYAGGADALEKALTSTYLVVRSNGFLQDTIMRRVLAMRLRLDEPQRFLDVCAQAIRLYTHALQRATARPEYFAREVLFQELQWRYHQETQDSVARAALRRDFFGDDGILYRYARILAARSDIPSSVPNLRNLLRGAEDDWEFRFQVNFCLRDDSYDDRPYQTLLECVEQFFEQA